MRKYRAIPSAIRRDVPTTEGFVDRLYLRKERRILEKAVLIAQEEWSVRENDFRHELGLKRMVLDCAVKLAWKRTRVCCGSSSMCTVLLVECHFMEIQSTNLGKSGGRSHAYWTQFWLVYTSKITTEPRIQRVQRLCMARKVQNFDDTMGTHMIVVCHLCIFHSSICLRHVCARSRPQTARTQQLIADEPKKIKQPRSFETAYKM